MKYGIAVPCLSTVATQFMASLVGMEKPIGSQIMIAESSLTYDARDTLGRQAIELGCDRILWLDSDMAFTPDLMNRLIVDMDKGYEFVTGLYMTRKHPIEPVIFKTLKINKDDQGYATTTIDRYYDYPDDEIFQVAACGFGVCMMTTDLFRRIAVKFGGSPFTPFMGMGEDIAFCYRAGEVGAKLYCDSSIKAQHIGIRFYGDYDYRRKDDKHDGVKRKSQDIKGIKEHSGQFGRGGDE